MIDVRGMAGATLEAVRAEARVSSSQIYHYFTDRESLILAAVDGNDVALAGDRSPMAANFTSVEAIRAWGDELIAQQRISQYRNVCPILNMNTAVGHDGLRERAVIGLRRLERDMQNGYRTMQRKAELHAGTDPDRLAAVTLATVLGGLVLTQLQQDPAPLASAVGTVLDRLTQTPGNTRIGLYASAFGLDYPEKLF